MKGGIKRAALCIFQPYETFENQITIDNPLEFVYNSFKISRPPDL